MRILVYLLQHRPSLSPPKVHVVVEVVVVIVVIVVVIFIAVIIAVDICDDIDDGVEGDEGETEEARDGKAVLAELPAPSLCEGSDVVQGGKFYHGGLDTTAGGWRAGQVKVQYRYRLPADSKETNIFQIFNKNYNAHHSIEAL